jgi:TusA-related sulfurtransferase
VSLTPPAVQILVEALLRKDFTRLRAALDPAVRFRALAPGETVDVSSAAEAAGVFQKWFGDKDDLDLVESEAEQLVDRTQVRYRLRLRKNGEPYLVEQRLCGDLEGGRFVVLDLLCSGFRPCGVSDAGGSVHRFDAGDLACGTGLPREFRARLGQIPVGHQLEVVTHDPSAREDLPALTRMLGHRVVAVDSRPDGEITVRVERTR